MAEAGNAAEAALFCARNLTRNHCPLIILHVDAAGVFPIADYRNAVGARAGQGANLELDVHAHVRIAMHDRLHFQRNSDVLVGERGHGRNEGIVGDDLRDRGGVEDGREAGVDDRVTRTEVHGCIFSLGGAHCHVLE